MSTTLTITRIIVMLYATKLCVEVHLAAALGFMDGFSDLILNHVIRLVPDFLA